ncbi:hypothetical protein ACOMHN_025826 [Nucella lapillus]
MTDPLQPDRLLRKQNLNLQKQLDVTLQILSEEYRQCKDRMHKEERDCGKFLQSLYATVPDLQSYEHPHTRSMTAAAIVRERLHSFLPGAPLPDGASHPDGASLPDGAPLLDGAFLHDRAPHPRPKGNPLADSDHGQRDTPASAAAVDGRQSIKAKSQGGKSSNTKAAERSVSEDLGSGPFGRGGQNGIRGKGVKVHRPKTAGSNRSLSIADQDPKPDRPRTSFGFRQSSRPFFGKSAYSEHDRSVHDFVLQRFQSIFDPEVKSDSPSMLPTCHTPPCVARDDRPSADDERSSSTDDTNDQGQESLHGDGGQIHGDQHCRRLRPPHRRVVWSARPHRKTASVSAPDTDALEIPSAETWANQADIRRKPRSHSLSLPSTSLGGFHGHDFLEHSHVDSKCYSHVDPKIWALALQRNPVTNGELNHQAEDHHPPFSDTANHSTAHTEQNTTHHQLQPQHNQAINTTRRLSVLTKSQSETNVLKKHQTPRSLVQMAASQQGPLGPHIRMAASPQGNVSSPGHPACRRRHSALGTPSSRRPSDPSVVMTHGHLVDRAVTAAQRSAPHSTRPVGRSELSHRFVPVSRKTIVCILSEIENQKASTRTMVSASRELHDFVKKLTPQDQLLDDDLVSEDLGSGPFGRGGQNGIRGKGVKVHRPKTAGSNRSLSIADQDPKPDRPRTSFGFRQSSRPFFGKSAYSEHDRSVHDFVLQRFQSIFDPEVKSDSPSMLPTCHTPPCVARDDRPSADDERSSSTDDTNDQGQESLHGDGGQIHGDQHCRRLRPPHRRVVWSARPHRKTASVSAPDTDALEIPSAETWANQADIRRKPRSHSLSLPSTSLGGFHGHDFLEHSHVDSKCYSHVDPKIWALALQRNPVTNGELNHQAEDHHPPFSDTANHSTAHTEQNTTHHQLQPQHNQAINTTRRLSVLTKSQSETNVLKKHQTPRSLVQMAASQQGPLGPHIRMAASPQGNVSSPGHPACRRRHSALGTPSSRRPSDPSVVMTHGHLVDRAVTAAQRSAPHSTRPVGRSELSHRFVPVSRKTIVCILSEIENQKASTRTMVSASRELHDFVKKLTPQDQLLDDDLLRLREIETEGESIKAKSQGGKSSNTKAAERSVSEDLGSGPFGRGGQNGIRGKGVKVHRPKTAGSNRSLSIADQDPKPDRPRTSFGFRQSSRPFFGKSAYSEHDRSVHDFVLQRFQSIFDPEVKSDSPSMLPTCHTPPCVARDDRPSADDERSSSTDDTNDQGQESLHGDGGQIHGDQHCRRLRPPHRRVVWSARPHRKTASVSAPDTDALEIPSAETWANQADIRRKPRSHSLSLPSTSLGGFHGHDFLEHSHVDSKCYSHVDPKIWALALQRNPVTNGELNHQAEDHHPPFSDTANHSTAHTEQNTTHHQLQPQHNQAINTTRRLSVLTKSQSDTNVLKKHQTPRSLVQMAASQQGPLGPHIRMAASPQGNVSSPGHPACRRRHSALGTPSSRRPSDPSVVMTHGHLVDRAVTAAQRSAPHSTRPVGRSELSHRFVPVSRKTIVCILSEIENQKASTRTMVSASRELHDFVKKLTPQDQLLDDDLSD